MKQNTLQDLVNKFVKDHWIFTIETKSNLPCPSGNNIEYQLRETNDNDLGHELRISTFNEDEFYRLVVEYLLKQINLK